MTLIDAAWLDREGERIARAPDWLQATGRLPTADDEWVEITRRLPLIDPGKWEGQDVPDRQWAWADNIPHRQCTYLTGPGSAGKSLFGQQLATCHALARPFLGVETRGGPALYVTCEDDEQELHRRQKAICRALSIRPADLSGKLHLTSLAGALGTELYAMQEGELGLTDRFRGLEDGARAIGAKLIVLDNVAHLFGGNENARNEVAAFVSLLNRLAMRIDGAVLLIGHPNKAGDSFSGSTAWENQVRSRLFMQVPEDCADRDMRVLSRQKSNYAKHGEQIAFRWHEWAFVLDDDLPDDRRADLAATALAGAENAAFLKCLAQRTQERRHVSEKVGANYAPKVFATMAEAKGIKKERLIAAMDRLFRLGAIERGFLWRDTAEGKDIFGLRETGNVTGNRPETTSANDRKPAEINRKTHPILLRNTGAANQAAAPGNDIGDPTTWGDA